FTLAGLFLLVGRRGRVDALLVALGTTAIVLLVDVATGAHLEWNAVFGYSPTIGIRLAGVGNLAFACLTSSACLFAGLLVWRSPTVAARRVAAALLVATVVVIGAPFWGDDLGGMIAT